MKHRVEKILQNALKQLQSAGVLFAIPAFIELEITKDKKKYGDFSTNVAMIIAKAMQKKTRDVAEQIIQAIPPSPYIQKIKFAEPGFINFFLSSEGRADIVRKILSEKENFGRTKLGREKRILMEFVSSNPIGPLHVGQGRQAVVGDVISNLLDAVGFKTYREYYVNDSGLQMDMLTISIWLEYLRFCGENINFPTNLYKGKYITDIAYSIYLTQQTHFFIPAQLIFENLPQSEMQDGTKDVDIEALINQSKRLLQDKYLAIFDLGFANILADIREDLSEFGVHYDNWFSEKEFIKTKYVEDFIDALKQSSLVYVRNDATWFCSTSFEDEKDRVLIKPGGQQTYFAIDAAYHFNKFQRGFDVAINLFGIDHHPYVLRIKAAIKAMGVNPERLIHILIQFVTLPKLVKKSGGLVFNPLTLRQLREEVGNNAVRFFYLLHKSKNQIKFNLDIEALKTKQNPLFYIQYAQARIYSVFKKMEEKKLIFNLERGLMNLNFLTTRHERELLNTLTCYPDIIINAALNYEPYLLTCYLRKLASNFHAYYSSHQFIVENAELRDARLALIAATLQTLINGFDLLGINAVNSM